MQLAMRSYESNAQSSRSAIDTGEEEDESIQRRRRRGRSRSLAGVEDSQWTPRLDFVA